MNRLQYILRAKTQFSLHSPFVYRLYTEVLCSHCPGHGRSATDILWRLEEYYGIRHSTFDSQHSTLSTPDGLFIIVDHPHRDEKRWRELIDNPQWQVTLDLFTAGVAVANPRLSKQHFILR